MPTALVTPEGHGLGWLPHLEAPARTAWAAEGQPPRFEATVFAADDRPLPAAFTLADQIKFWFNQGPVGSCFANAAAQSLQIGRSAAVAAGSDLEEVELSRAMAWYEGRKLDGSIGGDDGGSITNVMRGLFDVGTCLDRTLPYKPNTAYLDRKPPLSAMAEAKDYRLTGTVDLNFNDKDAQKRVIVNGHPPVPGIWWCFGWDGDNIDAMGRTTGIGRGVFGHALCKIGWADPGVFDGHLWWHYLNSHGAIYPVLPPEQRAKVIGYATARPDRCYAFWVRDDLEARVVSYGNSELIAPAGVGGYTIKRLLPWERSAS